MTENETNILSKLVFQVLNAEQQLMLSSKVKKPNSQIDTSKLLDHVTDVSSYMKTRLHSSSSSEFIEPTAIYLISLVRIVSYCVSQNKCEIHDVSTVYSILQALEVMLSHQIARSVEFLQDERNVKSVGSLLLLLSVILEFTAHDSIKNDEAFVLAALICFERSIETYISNTESLSLPSALSGPFLAQFVQSLLRLTHSCKPIATRSISCFQMLINLTSSPRPYADKQIPGYIIWRTYYPGIFSGLFSLCMGKDSRPSDSVKAQAITLVLLVTRVVVSDDIHANILSRDNSIPTASERFLSCICTSIVSAEQEQESYRIEQKEYARPKGMPFIEASPEWRVDLLQKLQQFLPVLWKCCSPSSSDRLRQNTSLVHLLLKSQSFLGPAVRKLCVCFLLERYYDNDPNVRVQVREFLRFLEANDSNMFSQVLSNKFMFWDEIRKGMVEAFFEEIRSLGAQASRSSRVLSKENNPELLRRLNSALGLMNILKDSLACLLRIENEKENMYLIVSKLLVPSLGGISSSVLANKRYYSSDGRFVEEGYYRVVLGCSDDKIVTACIGKLCIQFGRLCDLSDMQSTAAAALKRVQRTCSRQNRSVIDDASDVLTERLLQGCGVFAMLTTSILGCIKVSNAIKSSCTLCNAPVEANRCMRCQSVSYCSKKHQLMHWKQHKQSCIEKTIQVGPDLNDPEIVLSTSTTYDHENQTQILPTMKIIVNTCLDCLLLYQTCVSHDPSVNSSCNGLRRLTDNKLTTQERTLLALLTSNAMECIANTAFILRKRFRSFLSSLLYVLIELLVDPQVDIVVRQASSATVTRLSLYLDYHDVHALLKDNIDYLVDRVCIDLRSSVAVVGRSMSSMQLKPAPLPTEQKESARYNYRAALVVDAVFGAFGSYVVQPRTVSTPIAGLKEFVLLKDMVLDSLDNVDILAAANMISESQIVSLLRVMNVMVYRALPPVEFEGKAKYEISEGYVQVQTALLTGRGVHKLFLANSSSHDKETTPVEDPKGKDDENVTVYDRTVFDVQEFSEYLNKLFPLDDKDTPSYDSSSTPLQPPSPQEDIYEALDDDFDDEVDDGTVDQDEGSLVKQEVKVPPGFDLLVDILSRCCYFLSMWGLDAQVIVVDTMTAAFRRLAAKRGVFLPAVHKSWSCILQRFKEQRVLLSLVSPYFTTTETDRQSKRGDSSLLKLETLSISRVPKLTPLLSPLDIDPVIVREISRKKTLLLPPLLDLFAFLAYTCGDFLAMKFEEELWPELTQIIRVISADALGAICENKSTDSVSRFEVTTKLKISTLNCVMRLAKMPGSYKYVRHVVGPILWLIAPLLSSSQHQDVISLGARAAAALVRFDQPFGRSVLYGISEVIMNPQSNSMNIWVGLVTEPSIIAMHTLKSAPSSSAAASCSKCCVPGCDRILDIYRSDAMMGKRLREVYEADVLKGVYIGPHELTGHF